MIQRSRAPLPGGVAIEMVGSSFIAEISGAPANSDKGTASPISDNRGRRVQTVAESNSLRSLAAAPDPHQRVEIDDRVDIPGAESSR